MGKEKWQIQIKAPSEEDPNHHCSVSEAGGDDEDLPKNAGGTSSRLGGLKDGMLMKLGSIRSGVSKFGTRRKGGEPDGSSDLASSAMRSSNEPSRSGHQKNSAGLTEEQLQAHGGQTTGQLTPYRSEAFAAPSQTSGRSGSKIRSQAEAYSSYYTSASGVTSEGADSGQVYGSRYDDEEPISPRIWPPPHPDRKVHIRRRKFAAGFSLVSFWTVLVSGALFAYIWQYFIVEVDEVQGFVAAAAMKQVQVRTEALLAPAFSVARSLSLSMKMGSSPMDYQVLHRLLAPQFRSSPVLSEVHLAEATTGSILVQPGTIHVDALHESQRSLLFRSDRSNCNEVARSCALQPMKANVSDWYTRGTSVEWKTSLQNRAEEEAFTLPVTWHGPSFLKGSSYATAWNVYYWNAAYSLVSKLSWSSSMVLRVVLNANGLQDIVREAEQRSKGNIFICTDSGQVLAASDMSQAVQVNVNTGSVNFRHVWEMEQIWTSLVSKDVLANSKVQDFVWGWVFGTRVFVHPFEQMGNNNFGLKLRIVLAVPRSALALQWLEILSPVCAVFGVLPSLSFFAYLFGKYVQYKQVQMREKRERRRREFQKEKERQAAVKAERLGKLKNAKASLTSKLPGKGKKKAKK